MHGAALALAVSGGAAVELGERTVDAGAFGEGVAVAAVGAGHVIVVGEVAAYAGGDGLLADVQVGGADDLLADVRLDGFLEPADLAHGGVEVNGLLRGQWCAHDVRAFVCSLVCFLLDVGGAWARPDLCRALHGNRRGMAVSCMVRLTTCAAVLHGCHAGPYGRPAKMPAGGPPRRGPSPWSRHPVRLASCLLGEHSPSAEMRRRSPFASLVVCVVMLRAAVAAAFAACHHSGMTAPLYSLSISFLTSSLR